MNRLGADGLLFTTAFLWGVVAGAVPVEIGPLLGRKAVSGAA